MSFAGVWWFKVAGDGFSQVFGVAYSGVGLLIMILVYAAVFFLLAKVKKT